MRKISEILDNVDIIEIKGNPEISISALELDSRKAGEGVLFAALRGTAADGHAFIAKAVENGAAAILCEELPADIDNSVCYIRVKDSRAALGLMASAFYGDPSAQLTLVGVTGTNGKTTVATTLFNLFTALGYPCGLISTVENRILGRIVPSTHTTPDVISLNALLEEMYNEGCDYVFMEVSSHAVVQGRISGLQFAGAIFTNITHDHLDYHGTFENYLKAKKAFFDQLPEDAWALTNRDDRNGAVMLQNTKATRYGYALHSGADFRARILEEDLNGMLLNLDGVESWYSMVGTFNAYNLLAVYGAAFLLNQKKEEVITHLTRMPRVRGRFEAVPGPEGRTGVVDYAHTPDALKNVLKTINGIRTRNEVLITVIGCGGNRDAEKRPEMGRIAAELSDKVILTSDNPRNEDPELIIQQMRAGVPPEMYKKVLAITDRREAIRTAYMMSQGGDIILVAGKGHETYQEVKGQRTHFDDREELLNLFNQK